MAADMTIGQLIIERRIDQDGDSWVYVRDGKIGGEPLGNFEAVTMLEIAKAVVLAQVGIEDA